MKKLFAILTLCSLLLTGCSEEPPSLQPNVPEETTGAQSAQTQVISTAIDPEKLFTKRDRQTDYAQSESARITLSGDSAQCTSNAVRIDGTTVTILDEGTYVLQGSLQDGQIVVDAAKEDKTQLVLEGVDITSSTGAALYIRQADKVFVTLAPNSENSLKNGGSFAADENNVDGAVFSKEDVTFNGTGSLVVTSPAGHGIVSKDALTVTGGSYTIESTSHGIAGKDSVAIADASMKLTTGKDGLHAENNDDTTLGYLYIQSGSFVIDAQGDGISAANAMQLDGGSYQITTGGGSVNGQKPTSEGWGGMGGGGEKRPGKRSTDTDTTEDSTSIKGVKAAGNLVINGGDFTVDAADDAIHSNSDLTVNGGTFQIATGDDGFHADSTLSVASGTVQITKSYEGLEGLHIKVLGGAIKLTASDDGLNAAGGTDQSGFGGIRGDRFGGRGGGGMSAGNGSILISGGTVQVAASGDGIDANGTLEITGGDTVVCGPTRGDTATLDYDKTAVISGGTFIGTGAAGMAQTFSDSQQGVFAVQVGNQSAGTQITLTDASGNVLVTYAPPLDFAVVILSAPQIKKGESYTCTVGTTTGTYEAY